MSSGVPSGGVSSAGVMMASPSSSSAAEAALEEGFGGGVVSRGLWVVVGGIVVCRVCQVCRHTRCDFVLDGGAVGRSWEGGGCTRGCSVWPLRGEV